MLYSFSLFSVPTAILEVLLVIVPALLSVAYVTVAERKTMASMQRRVGPVWWLGKSSTWDKLSNSGDLLKPLVPSFLSGWINYSGMVISQKIYENIMEYRGSKSIVELKYTIVKEQRVNGNWHSKCLRYTLKGFERNYQIRIPSNQINKLRDYSTDSNKNYNNSLDTNRDPNPKKLDPYFLTGFSDASPKKLVVWGTNFTSTVGEKFTLKQLAMVQLAPYQYSVIIGLMLSDGWLTFASKTNKKCKIRI